MNNRQAWLELRRKSIGASDAVILLRGPQFGKDESDVLRSKLEVAPHIDSDDIRRGTLYEHVVLSEYGRIDGDKHDRVEAAGVDDPMSLFFHAGHCHASLDGLAHNKDGSITILEVKCPRIKKAADTERMGATQEWKIQSRYQQAVYHLATGFPGDRIGGKMVIWHSEEARYHTHDTTQTPEEFEESVSWARYCDDWYRRHVILGDPLEATVPPVPIEVWQTMHLCDPNEEMICQAYQRACEAVKAAEEEKKLAASELEKITSANKARKMIFAGGTITRVVQSGRSSLDMDRVRSENPSIEWAKYEKRGSDFVTWRVGK
jgi:hypothetical protein